ncbi:DUF971 domain-containing protein [Candidatus Protochlamydia phocaeensis]|uniref:DUF971 domain-containing protein n=1 Tax=Candidatus Protochlamydia phocaeensis TaxID=1414722 RepID=UPI00083912F2|nr:DUF971 domain-containing protein [Candidatus Protochlamydia phocaeensis]
MNMPLAIHGITQEDNHTFSITWSDGQKQRFRLSDLQRVCPCANCVDEHTGKRRMDSTIIRDDVRATAIRSVGRYALQIQFTSGCSTGIYSFDMLRKMGIK